MNQQEFLQKYNIDETLYYHTGLDWEELAAIYDTYQAEIPELTKLASYLDSCLSDIPKVHAIKTRCKNPEHLLVELIRHKLEQPDLQITLSNYKQVINDFINIRVLHLAKEDWVVIHEAIMGKWNTNGLPTANIKKTDSVELSEQFKSKGCDVKVHPLGYRSIHYLIPMPFYKENITVEIQLKTVFEEACNEIDYTLRYSADYSDPVLAGYLSIFNRLADSADEMGAYLKVLQRGLDTRIHSNLHMIGNPEVAVTLPEELLSSPDLSITPEDESKDEN